MKQTENLLLSKIIVLNNLPIFLVVMHALASDVISIHTIQKAIFQVGVRISGRLSADCVIDTKQGLASLCVCVALYPGPSHSCSCIECCTAGGSLSYH